MPDSRLVISLVTTSAATAAAFLKDFDAFTARGSLVAQMNQEKERILEIDKFLPQLNSGGNDCAACEALKKDRTIALNRLGRLITQFSKRREDPNSDLSFTQRVFLRFPPQSQRGVIIHCLAATWMAIGLIATLCGIVAPSSEHSVNPAEYIADFMLLGCVGFLICRSWALAERKWSLDPQFNCSSPFRDALLITAGPAPWRFRVMQIFLWSCLYWIIESIEDFIGDTAQQKTDVWEWLLKFIPPVLALIACRLWADAEGEPIKQALTPGRRLSWGAAIMICIVAIWIAIALERLRPFNGLETGHKIAFAIECFILSVALSQWLAIRTASPGTEKAPAKAHASVA